ncbi:MAG: prepilin-type N-terminal cleavage/methylation domain-containing protein [Candidatus Buchananbacteria bacterium]|jgi:prepilin-type N-terminal cleavage/methylation domain-containing protein
MKGFTLIELILVILVMTLIAAFSMPFFQSFQISSDLNTEANTIVQALRRVQQQAIIGQNNSAWGVYFNSAGKNILLFKGASYAGRDQEYDQSIDYQPDFSLATNFGSEINFAIYTGKPSVNGMATITSQNNESKNISIDSFGLIQIN